MKEKIGNIVVLLIAIIVVLLLCEGIIRVFASQKTQTLFHNNYYPHAQYGWTFKPNFKKDFLAADFSVRIETNEQGFRGPQHDYIKKPHTYRILGLGDSMLFGWGVNYDEIVLSQLEGMLQADSKFKDKHVESINMGIPAYSTPQYRKLSPADQPNHAYPVYAKKLRP